MWFLFPRNANRRRGEDSRHANAQESSAKLVVLLIEKGLAEASLHCDTCANKCCEHGSEIISSKKNQKSPGTYKIGAAISGPKIAAENLQTLLFF